MYKKYFIGFELPKKQQKSTAAISNYLVDTYGVHNVLDKYNPHMTFKAPFEADLYHIDLVSKWLTKFVIGRKAIKLHLDGFGHFNIGVIYRDVTQSTSELTDLQKELCSGLEQFSWIIFDSVEPNGIPHVTVAIDDIRGRFQTIFKDLKSKFDKEESFAFNKLHLFEKNSSVWNIKETYLFG